MLLYNFGLVRLNPVTNRMAASDANGILLSKEGINNTASKRNSHIVYLPLDKRTRTALLAEGIETAEDISRMSERELLRIPNLGSKSVAEIRGVLSAFGFS